MINYTLTHSKRKTIGLYIRNGGVEVRAPLKMPKPDIDKFVVSKEKWIKDMLTQSNERNAQRDGFILNYGDHIAYRGKQYPIEAKDGSCVDFDDNRFYVPPDLSPDEVKAACIQIYRILAKRVLTEKVLVFAKRLSVMPLAVKINGAKTRWGSCSNKKSINFSWRLIMADDEVIDYVVVHELAHITEMNHSKRFWAIVESFLPDYRVRQDKLKGFQQRLGVEDWE